MPNQYELNASAVYNPQQQSEEIGLDRQKAGAIQGLAEEEQTIDPYYNDAVKSATKTRQSEGYQLDHLYSSNLSGFGSGGQVNDQVKLSGQLQEGVGRLEGERATKKGNIATRRRMVGDDYTAGMSALAAKYTGLRSTYIIDAQNRDADINRAEKQRQQDRQWAVADAGSNRAFQEKMAQWQIDADKANKPKPEQILSDIFTEYNKNDPKQKGRTETGFIPAYMAQTGKDYESAKRDVYAYRKKVFGE